MAAFANLSSEERVGVSAAVIVHVALAAGLAWQAMQDPPVITPAERIDVSLATEVSLESTAPDPSAEPAMSIAPELGEVSEAPQDVAVAQPQPDTRPRPPLPFPTPPRNARPAPTPTPTAARTQAPRVTPTPTPSAAASRPPRGSILGNDFLEGSSDARGASGSPAATFGPAERASLEQAISRQLARTWRGTAPSGVDAELLVSTVRWRLNRDGTLRGSPSCSSQRGVNDSNRPQASIHCERAIRAVRRAAPFNLPEQFYSRWDDLEWDFDRSLG
ncbi:hypothetical protein [Aurantiacibacter gangjinensis]|uniref:Uncharacterized protein n=1 Tax=Aurantiacibacter gangjinensis TaxID=502682 RepID=A0A0G9MMV8_9SPHN|nr:hypothetical protein [Aurantiacibacter gangjinensis]APE28022.1 TolA protein [Aurantiacibacter gangjinensis]KLE31954.1 hypothetical protein AAW01_10975 [Aurantiacibacter gangjinensis]